MTIFRVYDTGACISYQNRSLISKKKDHPTGWPLGCDRISIADREPCVSSSGKPLAVGQVIGSSPISSTIHEKSELLHDWKCIRIFCLHQRHSILMPMPRGLYRPLGIFVLSALFRQRILLCHHKARHHLQTEQPWIETLNDGSFLGISFDIPSLVLF